MLDTLIDAYLSFAVVVLTATFGWAAISLVAIGVKAFKRWRKDVNRC